MDENQTTTLKDAMKDVAVASPASTNGVHL